ncbi:MAG: hypothetical protein IJ088_02390, partial [Clostridia bacterium]|nr:hypothetical protein [Clostridia bacterium]
WLSRADLWYNVETTVNDESGNEQERCSLADGQALPGMFILCRLLHVEPVHERGPYLQTSTQPPVANTDRNGIF